MNKVKFLYTFLILLLFFNISRASSSNSLPDSIQLIVKTTPRAKLPEKLNNIAADYLEKDPALTLIICRYNLDENIVRDDHDRALLNYLAGEAAYRMKKFHEAEKYLNESISKAEKISRDKLYFRASNSLAKTYKELKRNDEAIAILTMVVDECHGNALRSEKASAYHYMGSIMLNNGKYDIAEEHYLQSARIRQETGDTMNLCKVLINLATLYRYKNDHDKAEKKLTEARLITSGKKYRKDYANVLYNEAVLALQQKKVKIARDKYLQSLDLRKKIGLQSAIGQSLAGLGYYYRLVGNYDSAVYYYQKSHDLYAATRDTFNMANTLHYLGSLNFNFNYYEKALAYYLESLKLKEHGKNKAMLSTTLQTIGNLYHQMGNYNMAIDYLKSSLVMHESNNDLKGMAYVHNLLGNVYKKKGSIEKARINYEQSLEIRKNNGSSNDLASIYNNLGMLETKTGSFEEAREHFESALEVYRNTGNTRGIMIVCNNIGNLYQSRGDDHHAIGYFKKAIKISNDLDDKFYLSLCSRKIGEAYMKSGNMGFALKCFNEASRAANELSHAELIKNAYLSLHDYYKKEGDYRSALGYYTRYTHLNDSLYKVLHSQKITELQTNYELEQKDNVIREIKGSVAELEMENKQQELLLTRQKYARNTLIIITIFIALLTIALYNRYKLKKKSTNLLAEKVKQIEHYNHQLTESEKELKKLNATKDTFFNIMAHDIKNSLIGMISLSRIFNKDFDNLKENDRKDFSRVIHQSANQLYKLLENLLHWARAQTGRVSYNPQNINIGDIAENCLEVSKLNIQNKQLKAVNNIKNIHARADKEMITLVIRNLISNAIKFTGPGGTIAIIGSGNENFVEIHVKDTGVGMEDEIKDNLFKLDKHITTPGTSNEEGTGLGLILCKEFILKHGGKIWVESEVNKGSTFKFTLPKPK